MREIKFRAWSTYYGEGQMLYDPGGWAGGDGVQSGGSFYLNEFIANCENEYKCVLMQYTGLKDKNGMEIYEGDVVHCADLGPVDMPLIQRTGHIEYAENTCTFGVWVDWTEFGTSNDGEARALWPMGHFRLSEHEVIGNIYENPGLLKQKMFRDRISKHLRENGIRVSRVEVIGDNSLIYYLSENGAQKIKRNLYTYQLDLDALISVAPDRGPNALRFDKAQFK